MTPKEAWSGHKSCVGDLRIFGSIAYSHVPDERISKLDDKFEKCIFVGYSESSKAYKLYNPITKKIIISKDLKFNEEESWDWDIHEKKQKSVCVDMEKNNGVQNDDIEGNEEDSTPPSSPFSSPSSSSSISPFRAALIVFFHFYTN